LKGSHLLGKKDKRFIKAVDIPQDLYQSMEGRYFVGYTEDLFLAGERSAWARLYNPKNSGVNLYVNVWTVTNNTESTFQAQFWFNADPPGTPSESDFVTPTNTAIKPLPKPKIKIEYASNVDGDPTGGTKAFIRKAQPDSTIVDVENGKFIIPPGGSFLVFLTDANVLTTGSVAFGWWEEKR
jgi:hypothetical protein